jgi:hypothetical protein
MTGEELLTDVVNNLEGEEDEVESRDVCAVRR